MKGLFQRFAGDGLVRGDQKTVAELIPSATDEQFEEGWCMFVVGLNAPPDLRSQGYFQAQASRSEHGAFSAASLATARATLINKFGYRPESLPK